MTTSLRAAAGLVMLAGLAACSHNVPGSDERARLPTEQFRAQVAEEPHEMALAVHGYGLSPTQRTALTSFANDWHAGAGAPIQLLTPNESDPTARRFGEQVRDHLVRHGVPDGAIQMAAGGEAGVMRVGYLRRVAVVPECGVVWTDLKRTAGNNVQPNFGCAVTSNMAVQMADPSDLLGPRPGEPADAGRRTVVTDRYRQGQRTGAAIDDAARGTVSNVN